MKDTIVNAVVFSDRALVTRRIDLDIKPGAGEYVFKHLPAKILKESVRAKGKGELVILGLDLLTRYLEDYDAETLQALKNELDEMKLEELCLQKEQQDFVFCKDFIGALKFDAINPMEHNSDVANGNDFQTLFDAVSNSNAIFDKKITSNGISARELKEKIEKLTFDVSLAGKGLALTVYDCTLRFTANTQGPVSLLLTYCINGAAWSPLYDARLNYKERKLALTYFAEVSQQTGEDWEDIELALSTASPRTGAFLPELAPWFVDFYYPPPPPPVKAKKMYAKGAGFSIPKMAPKPGAYGGGGEVCIPEADFDEAGIADSDDLASGIAIEEDKVALSEVKTTGLNVTFEAKTKYSIDSDGTVKKAVILLDDFPVELKYIIVPKECERAYLKAIISNDKNYPLLAGNVKVYHNNTFVGDSYIDNVVPQETFELFLGIDSQIDISYRLLNRFTRKTGVAGRTERVTYSYKTTVISYKEHEEEITVMEQIPISRDKEVKVKIEKQDIFMDPDSKGVLEAVFTLAHGEKKELYFIYYVEYPKERYVNGLE